MRSSLLLQQCSTCLIRLTWVVFVMGGMWPYSWFRRAQVQTLNKPVCISYPKNALIMKGMNITISKEL